MVRVILEDFEFFFDPLTGHACELGYGLPATGEVVLDIRCLPSTQDRTLVHEIIEMFCFNDGLCFPHERIDLLVQDILEGQKQLRRLRDGQ